MNTKNFALIAAIMAIVAVAAVAIPSEDVDAVDSFSIEQVNTAAGDGGSTIMQIVLSTTVDTLSTVEVVYDGTTYSFDIFQSSMSSVVITVGAVIDGDYTITVYADGTNATYTTESGDTPVDPEVTYTVTIDQPDNGTIAVEGDVDLTAVVGGTELTFTVTADEGYVVVGESTWTVTVDSDMEVSLPEGVSIVAETVDPEPEPDTGVDPDKEFTNTIILSDGTVIDSDSSIVASGNQEVLITGDVTVAAGGYIIVNGKLTIQDGASLTVDEGGQVIILDGGIVDVSGELYVEAGAFAGDNGHGFTESFVYQGAWMLVSGEVYLYGVDAFVSEDATGVVISGYFEVGSEASAALYGATVEAGGELTVYGVIEGAVENYGTVTIDSEGLEDGTASALAVLMYDGAVVDVINAYGTVIVTDAGITYTQRDGTEKEDVNDSMILLENVSGVTVTETVVITTRNNVNTYTNTMYIEGDAAYTVDYAKENDAGDIWIYGDAVEVSAALDLGKGVSLHISGELTVSGTIDGTAGTVDGHEGGVLTVTGKVTVLGSEITGCSAINAARYYTGSGSSTTYVYTTLETALDDGATSIALMGRNTVLGDAVIPTTTTVTMEAMSVLVIDDEATLTVAAEGRSSGRLDTNYAGDYSVVVDGTLVIENLGRSNFSRNANAVLSDTRTASGDSVTYTNIYNALTTASEGDTVEVSRNNGVPAPEGSGVSLDVVLDADVTVPTGVTLYIPAVQGLTVGNGVTVTVDGTVYAYGAYDIAKEEGVVGQTGYKAPGATVVNGLFMFFDQDDSRINTYVDYIDGAYFGYMYNKTAVYAIAPLESMPGYAADVTTDWIVLVGDMTVGDVDFSAYDGEVIELVAGYFGDDLTVGSLTLGGSIYFNSYYGSVTGTIVLADGSIDVENVCLFEAWNEYDAVTDTTTSMVGFAFDVTQSDEEYADPVYGSVTFNGEVTTSALTSIYVTMTVASGATVTVIQDDGTAFYGPVIVEGSLVIADSGIRFNDLTVSGTVSATGSNTATANRVYVGVTADEYYLAGTGDVSGVILDGTSAAVYVSPNATYASEQTGLISTEYYAEDELVLTAYALRNNTVGIKIEFSVENARFDGWYYYQTDGTVKEVEGERIGAATEVYADIEYAIYSIIVVGDSGIGSVAIDGNVLVNAIGNIFYLTTPLTAGSHTLTYTLKSGYEGTATLTATDGYATVSGMSFTLSGTPDTSGWEYAEVTLSLSGTTAADSSIIVNVDSGSDGSDGLGLTDILLIVLVILIIVMAIIVALRLMRS